MHGDVFHDSCGKFGDAGKHVAAQAFGCNIAKESLDHIQPRSRGWRKACREPGMRQPLPDLGMFVGRVVVANQMQGFVFRRFALDLTQEFGPFGMAMVPNLPSVLPNAAFCKRCPHKVAPKSVSEFSAWEGRLKGLRCGILKIPSLAHRF